ncbi:sensor domain-containing diguanylate cyclase [Porphyrobacter sp. LM 6]|uniref:sensor domain-containing diguanylate cyclase n=1 Tax=Porphyrobacter sp. LM 6 TaxID=1896196 RepID=UPI000846F908|nr:diguanylate cyclase [Porphyrobacter sp. LM 6]AOL93563.1 diguanylate cyclase (GGDEF) domain-containing protein [Porphyrobacter sp. LM 6]
MPRLYHLIRLCLTAVLLAMFVARPAAADVGMVPNFTADCHAATAQERRVDQMLTRAAWTCSEADWRSDVPAVWLRFDSAGWEKDRLPVEFFSRTARFESISFYAVDTDGTIRTRHMTESAGTPVPFGPVFTMPLPPITRDTAMLLVRVEAPHSVPLLTEARISHDHTRTQWPHVNLLLLALVMGMLVLPLLFDISFFLVLRERFVVIHAAMVSAMMVYILTAGGLITTLVTLPIAVLAVLAPLSYAIGGGLSALFLLNFLERGAQSRLMRRITLWGGWFTMIVPGFMALQLDATQPFDDVGYFITYLPFIGIITAALLEALVRGSRSARFLAVAWAPIIIASVERLLRGLGWHVAPQSFDHLLYIAVGIEVVVISLAIADRFFALRHERDAALSEARKLEQLSTRDSLTGLMNRRAIEARFEELIAQGFDTFALVDLDRFKAINDLHGHQMGDAALVACADAIRGGSDRDTIAVRLGGEEFVVLLRGERSLERAEALRQAIPMRIAQVVPGLDLPVTASMGVIMLADADRHQMKFSEFYARADALMYEAKASGRNRLAYERLTVFSPPPKAGRRRAA